MEKEMEKEKYIIMMINYNFRDNIKMVKEIEKEKKIIIMVI